MKVVYDNIVYSLQNIGGISSYWYELSLRLLKKKELDLLFYETNKPNTNILRKNLNIPNENLVNLQRISLFYERFSKLPAISDSNIFHSSYFRIPVKNSNTKVVTTIHDFTHDLYYKGPRVWLHNHLKNKAVKESDVIITVSENTKTDLLNFFPKINEANVKVIYNGVSSDFKVLDNPASQGAPYFLFIGSREHYKNFQFAVEIAAAYKDFDFYIVGSALSAEEEKFVNHHLQSRYKVFTGIDVAQLNKLYNEAFCLLYPSSYEGFGIPLLEAMKAGCPFIALKTSSIPEVAGDAGVLISGLFLDEAKDAVERILTNRESMVQRGFIQSGKFSWDSCFKETYDLYLNI